MRSVARVLWFALLCGWLAACGVPLQEAPEEFPMPTDKASTSGPVGGGLTATVYLADDARLVPVERATDDPSLHAVLLLLVEGATADEAARGVRSALVPGSLDPVVLERGPKVRGRVIEVAVTQSFTATTGDDQLLATAQLVWTVTDRAPARLVRAVVEGEPIELPTDEGLTGAPVGRNDYRTLAPEAE